MCQRLPVVPYHDPGVGSREVSGSAGKGQGELDWVGRILTDTPGESTRYSDQVLVELDEDLH